MDIIERPTPGIPEAMRAESMRITPKGCLSRSVAGIRKRTLIITLPGSKKASQENILAVIDPVAHAWICSIQKAAPTVPNKTKTPTCAFKHRSGFDIQKERQGVGRISSVR